MGRALRASGRWLRVVRFRYPGALAVVGRAAVGVRVTGPPRTAVDAIDHAISVPIEIGTAAVTARPRLVEAAIVEVQQTVTVAIAGRAAIGLEPCLGRAGVDPIGDTVTVLVRDRSRHVRRGAGDHEERDRSGQQRGEP